MIGLRTLPCISAKENENRQNLQAPDQHTQGEHQLGEAGKGGVVAHGAHQLQSGAHITDAGDYGGEGGAKGEVVHRHQQRGPQGDEKIGCKKELDGAQAVLIYHPAVQLDHVDGAGVHHLPDLPADALEQEQNAGALDGAAGGAGAGADEHEQHQQNPRNSGHRLNSVLAKPVVEIIEPT